MLFSTLQDDLLFRACAKVVDVHSRLLLYSVLGHALYSPRKLYVDVEGFIRFPAGWNKYVRFLMYTQPACNVPAVELMRDGQLTVVVLAESECFFYMIVRFCLFKL